MFNASFNRRRLRMALAIFAVVGALLGAQAPHGALIARASTPAAAPPPPTAKTFCAWPTAAIGKQRFGNTGFIDTNGLYLLMAFAYLPGPTLRIYGQFPHARYMSFTIYAGRSNVLVDRIADKDIVPNPGSINPFRPFANRDTQRRSYTITIREGLPPARGRAPNTIYTGPYHPALVMYRVYAPDQGADDYGDVGKPRIEYFNDAPEIATKHTMVPFCSTPKPARASPNFSIPVPLKWQRFGSQGGAGVNGDEAYLQMRLNHDDHDVTVLRFKAPTFANTYVGRRITGRENVRFWSLCMYDMQSTKVVACLHDYEAVRSRAGYVTVAISTLANRPSTATPAQGVNWLPFGPELVGMVTYRQLLPSPTFIGSLMNAAPDAYQFELQNALGRYLPTVQTCATAAFSPTNCSDQINPQFCTDLTEPAPCTNGAGSTRTAALIASRVRMSRSMTTR